MRFMRCADRPQRPGRAQRAHLDVYRVPDQTYPGFELVECDQGTRAGVAGEGVFLGSGGESQ